MKTFILISGLVFLSITASAIAIAPKGSLVQGEWLKACHDVDGDFLISQLKVTQKNSQILWTDSQLAFEEQGCASSGAYLQLERQYTATSSGQQLDLELIDVNYTPMTAEVAEALNGIEFCGIGTWQNLKKQSVIGKSCEDVENYASGQKLYSIYKISDKELYTGKGDENFDGSTPAKRHLQYEPLPYLKKGK